MKSGSTKTINGQLKTRNLSGVKFNSIYYQLSTNNRGNERNPHHPTWPIRSSLTSSKNTSLESSEAEDSSSETVDSNWYGSTSMFKVKKWLKQGKSDKKWQQEQNTMKTTCSKKMMAARTNIDVTSFHFLLSIARPFEKRFHEVFGNARILIFYLSIKAWEEKSLPKSYLGCFYIVFGKGKATKENMSIFWFILPLKRLFC